MNIVINIDVDEAHQPVNVLVKSASELVHFTTKSTSTEAKLLVQDTRTTSTLIPSSGKINNGKCTSTSCLRPLYTKTLCQACYRLLKRAAYTPSEEALACVSSWVEVVSSKPSAQQQRVWAKTFDEMVRIDKLTWDDITAINSHAFDRTRNIPHSRLYRSVPRHMPVHRL